MVVEKTGLEITEKHMLKLAKQKNILGREILQGIKYSDENKAVVTDSHRLIIVNYEDETFEDTLTNVRTNLPMDLAMYPDVNKVVPTDKEVPYKLKLDVQTIKAMESILKCLKQIKIDQVIIETVKCDTHTKCYLKANPNQEVLNDINIRLEIGMVEDTDCHDITLNTKYFLDVVQFVKDTKEDTTLSFGNTIKPIVLKAEKENRFNYQYILCPVRVYK